MRAIRMSAITVLAASVVGFSAIAASAVTGSASTGTAVTPTRVASFSVPAKHEIHSVFRISGTVREWNGKAWTPAGSIAVGYYYRVLPKGTWKLAGSGRTNSRGAFSWRASLIKLGHTLWQARVRAQQSSGIHFGASNSTARGSFFTDRTYVTHFVAMHLNGTTSLAAIIQDWPQSGGVSYTTPRGVAKFYYRPTGTSNWRYLGSSRTDSQGSVR